MPVDRHPQAQVQAQQAQEVPLMGINTDLTSSPSESESDPVPNDKKNHPSLLRRWSTGWKFTLSLSAASSILVLAFNLGFLLWAVPRHQLNDNRGVLYEGDCETVKRLSTGLHLLINILSTVLLGASNYGMQCLSAPTRRDINKVHAEGSYLDIGVQSLRNLFYIPGRRSFLWICLALSSLPLHLVYNSTIFATTAAYPYAIFAGHNILFSTPKSDLKTFPEQLTTDQTAAFSRLYASAQNASLTELDSPACVNAYATTYQTKHGDLLLITEDVNSSTAFDYVASQSVYQPLAGPQAARPFGDPYGWLCEDNSWSWCSTKLSQVQRAAKNGNWIVYTEGEDEYDDEDDRAYRVESCLAVKVPEMCKLQYSLPLTIVVIVVNAVKAVVMCYMVVMMADVPILTTGDAIASFLTTPDEYTRGRCLESAQQVKKAFALAPRLRAEAGYTPLTYTRRRMRRHSAASRCQWATILICWILAIIICGALLIHAHRYDGSAVWTASFGTINAQALIKGSHWPTSLTSNTLIANTPQLLFSILYFSFNSVMTTICLSTEWARFSLTRKPLRVSYSARGAQRSSYFLSLPYRYALPLMGASAVLHWLISQSLFLVGIEAYSLLWSRDRERDLVTCGYNPVAVVSSMAVAGVLFGGLVWMGFRGMPGGAGGMPVAGSCSLAIAAACQPRYDPNLGSGDGEGQDGGKKVGVSLSGPEDGESMMAVLPLRWGAVAVSGEIGHCTFTSEDVEVPEEGRMYQ